MQLGKKQAREEHDSGTALEGRPALACAVNEAQTIPLLSIQ